MSQVLPELPPEMYENIWKFSSPGTISSFARTSKYYHTATRPVIEKVRQQNMENLKEEFLVPIYHPSKWWAFSAYLRIAYGYNITEKDVEREIAALPFKVYINLYLIYTNLFDTMNLFENINEVERGEETEETNYSVYPEDNIEIILQVGLRAYNDFQAGKVFLNSPLPYRPYKFRYNFLDKIDLFIQGEQFIPDYELLVEEFIPAFIRQSPKHILVNLIAERANDQNVKTILPTGRTKDYFMRVLKYYHNKYPGRMPE